MRHLALAATSVLFACAGAPLPAAPHVDAAEARVHAASVPVAEPEIVGPLDAPERSRPPSTASYEQAMSTPELLDINDDSPHLTDLQIIGPIRGALSGCGVPSKNKVTIKTAVQYGRAIGVTVDLRIMRPKFSRAPSRPTTRAEAQASAKIAACIDHNVRAIVWPPSRRRDSSTTEF